MSTDAPVVDRVPASAAPQAGAPSPPPRAGGAEQRLDVLTGDRCCAGCGFNLSGQTIVREPHYGLLMVRCPECGAPAALQEYPSLARWVARLRLLAAAAYALVLLAATAATGAICYGFTALSTELVLAPYRHAAATDWGNWSTANLSTAQRNNWWGNQQVMETWWAGLPPQKYFADFGSWGALNWWGLLSWLIAAVSLAPIGMIWSIALAQQRGLRLLMILLIPLAFTGSLILLDQAGSGSRWMFDPSGLVTRQVGWLPSVLTIGACAVFLWAGALVGRPLARWYIALMLPPRLAAGFSFLWTVDGRELPRPRRPGKGGAAQRV